MDYKVNKMRTELNLTDSQADAIRPIIKDYLSQTKSSFRGSGRRGHCGPCCSKRHFEGIKREEYQKLSKILSEDQMKKWINKENLMAALNPDSVESTVDDGASLTASGANFKF